jgi:NADH-quinone oxidoreductase subunit G
MHACAAAGPALAPIVEAAPDHSYRSHGVKIPRQTQRYSGRTAMRANISVHEPKQPVDDETAAGLFTMEGLNRDEPGALLPYVWSPGWNSNQSLHKFQAEVGGPIRGGSAGVRLLRGDTAARCGSAPNAGNHGLPGWTLVPRPRIFGSDELSAAQPRVVDMLRPASLELTPATAQELALPTATAW